MYTLDAECLTCDWKYHSYKKEGSKYSPGGHIAHAVAYPGHRVKVSKTQVVVANLSNLNL